MGCNPQMLIDGVAPSGGSSTLSVSLVDASGILLTSANDILELVTGQSVSTDFTTSYFDIQTEAGGSQDGNAATPTTTTIVPAPAAGVTRQVREITITNNNRGRVQDVVLQKDVSGSNFRVSPATSLLPGNSLIYESGVGWYVLDTEGRMLVEPFGAGVTPDVFAPTWWMDGVNSDTRTITNNTTIALYLGRSNHEITRALCTWRITAVTTPTYMEVAIATGTPSLAANPTLTVRGFTDFTADVTTGIKRYEVYVASGSIPRGTDIWMLIGANAAGALTVRGGLADDLASGYSANAAVRPSLIVGTPTAFTVDVAAAVPYWWMTI
jgi:hypothetical protein